MSPTATAKVSNTGNEARIFFEELQTRICSAFEEIDGSAQFSTDRWERAGGGGGISRVMEGGTVFEKGGVNTSAVFGPMPESIARRMHVEPCWFFATGVSLVMHPCSPLIPTIHANFRYFEQDDGQSWFGGGTDLTPYYLDEEDAKHFHTILKNACDSVETTFYPRFKKWCDEYFYIKHREETRGVGGIFFDYLRDDHERHYALVRAVGNAFLESYLPIVRRHLREPWEEQQRAWQLLRRGRYVEFNLVYDRGTAFGLETGGRTESILMSLPPRAEWHYNVIPAQGSPESRLMEVLRSPKEWV
jgi:coproporphyrinogen III oxidase